MGGLGTGERFDLPEFVRRVADRGRVNEPAAVYQARVVLEVTDEATEGIMDKVRLQLPDDLRHLVDAGSRGDMD